MVAEATPFLTAISSREGLDTTGIVLIVGPINPVNHFPAIDQPSSKSLKGNRTSLAHESVQFKFTPPTVPGVVNRHSSYNSSFLLRRYPAALDAYGSQRNSNNNASSNLSTKNEQNVGVSVGYARPQTNLVDWVLIVEQAHSEAWKPIEKLRNILLACSISTAGAIILLTFPVAHFAVRPIRRLRDATGKSVAPPSYTPDASIHSTPEDEREEGDIELGGRIPPLHHSRSSKGLMVTLWNFRHARRRSRVERTEDARRRVLKVPGKVQDRRHIVTDELTGKQ